MSSLYSTFRVSNDVVNDPDALRARLDEDGYLFFRGVGPVQKLAAARRDVFAILADAGWIDPAASDVHRGVARWSRAVGPLTEGEAEYMRVYRQIINAPSFLAVPEDPVFMRLMGDVVGGEAACHRLRIGRVVFPGNAAQTTAAHQDWQYIRGAAETYTVWQPLVECPIELGPLAVLTGSHRAGFIDHREDRSKKYASMGLEEDQMPPGVWVTGDFMPGDFVLFHSHTIHKALPNVTHDRLRLSTDNRYQRVGAEMSAVARGSHYNL
jgi:hypothetical protein